MHDSRNARPVGRVVGLWRYPVKSMGAEALAQVDVSWHGFIGDRRWAFIRNDVPQRGFPWLTLRERGDMSHYRPSFVEPDRPDKSATVVRTPSGLQELLVSRGIADLIICGLQSEFCVDSTVRRAMALGYPVVLVADGHSTFDNGVLLATQISAHHNKTLSSIESYGARTRVVPAADIRLPNPATRG